MLPDFIYRSLPYIYIATGVFCAIVIDSDLVYFSSVLLMVTGLLVLWLRHAGGADYRPVKPSMYASVDPNPPPHVRKERRQMNARRNFPLINHNGEIIAFDRRIGLS